MSAAEPARSVFERLSTLFARGAALPYGGGVGMCAHMLQTAALAEQARASPHLVVASLLHDIGHFGTDYPDDFADDMHAVMLEAGTDLRHEEAGAALLEAWFGVEVTEPIRLHVAAKRYLCAVEAGYQDTLSATTRHTMALQGGPMTAAQVAAFEAEPFAAPAAQLRRWDDKAMVAEQPTPGFDHFRPLLESVLVP